MSSRRMLAIFATVVLVTLAFLLWQRVDPAKPVSTTTTSTSAAKTGGIAP